MSLDLDLLTLLGAFALICLAAHRGAELLRRGGLPLISGYLLLGLAAGPFILGLLSTQLASDLRFVDEISLGFIAFAAGSELQLASIRRNVRSIAWMTTGLVLVTLVMVCGVFLALSGLVPIVRDMPLAHRFGVSLLAGAIMVARSPSSAIALVHELRAKGPLTQTVLGVTMIKDVLVILLFAIASAIAGALIGGEALDPGFLGLLILELALALGLGALVSGILALILAHGRRDTVKAALILVAGYLVFRGTGILRHGSSDWFGHELLLEPLLVCMVAGFLVANFSSYRAEFGHLLHWTGPPIYVAFFTLTGASLQIDVLRQAWLIATLIFLTRLIAIILGSLLGGWAAGDPAHIRRVAWATYITQAGVGLGLAKEVAVEFPDWGPVFATVMISVIVLNQIVGPPLFKWAIHGAGESRLGAERSWDRVRDVLIFGLEGQSLALARQLRSQGWSVRIASLDRSRVERGNSVQLSGLEIHKIERLDLETLTRLEASKASTIVALLDDAQNLQICELAYQHFGTASLVARLSDRSQQPRFEELGAMTVEPVTAMVSLLDQLVRSPSAASILLDLDEGFNIDDIDVRDPALNGLAVRDLGLPEDMLVLGIRRGRQTVISHGYTRLRLGDRVTLMGSLPSLEQVRLRFDA
jgi:Trk K+ transport system NAD-binding subunit/Kef-type K+ transport system membrane component KefB